MKYRLFSTALVSSLLLMGCYQLWNGFGMMADNQSADTRIESSGTVTDADSLSSYLESQGFTVESQGSISQPFFSVEGQSLQVDSEDLQVFVFPDEASAADEAAQVPADGSSFPTIMITWVSEPHFFQSANVIVLYVGTNSELLAALESVFGSQFAGM